MARHPLSLIRLDAPAGWHDASVVSFIAPESTGFRANVLVTQEAVSDPDVSSFGRRQDAELSAALPKYRVIAREPIKVGPLAGLRVDYTFAGATGELVRQNVVYVLLGEIAYTLVLTCEDRASASMHDTFAKVLASFTIG